MWHTLVREVSTLSWNVPKISYSEFNAQLGYDVRGEMSQKIFSQRMVSITIVLMANKNTMEFLNKIRNKRKLKIL